MVEKDSLRQKGPIAMVLLVTRRQFLTCAAAVGALGHWSRDGGAVLTTVAARQVVRITWDPTQRSWSARPADMASRVLFISISDLAAPRPADFNLELGDVWWRHPMSPQTVAIVSRG